VNLVWRNLTPGTEGLCIPELVQLHRAQVEQFQHLAFPALVTYIAVYRAGFETSRGQSYPRGGGNWLMWSPQF